MMVTIHRRSVISRMLYL